MEVAAAGAVVAGEADVVHPLVELAVAPGERPPPCTAAARSVVTPDDRLKEWLFDRYRMSPPIVRAAVDALLQFEDRVDEMGYDISYYQEDLPTTVAKAILPWKKYDP